MPGRGKKRSCDALDGATGADSFIRSAFAHAPVRARNALSGIVNSALGEDNFNFHVRGNYNHLFVSEKLQLEDGGEFTWEFLHPVRLVEHVLEKEILRYKEQCWKL